MTKTRILLIEDDTDLADMISRFLVSNGFECNIEVRGDRAVTQILDQRPDAVILDIHLPGEDGFSICKKIRANYPGVIIILTARSNEGNEVRGLDLGADDFMCKPARPKALLARLRIHLRNRKLDRQSKTRYEYGDLMIDASQRRCEVSGTEIDLTTAEFDLLWLLIQRSGEVLSRSEIYMEINGYKYDGLDRSIDLRVSRLRKKLGDLPNSPERIKSIRGVGYMFAEKR